MTDATLPDLDHEAYIRKAMTVAERSLAEGNHPFGALLVGPDGDVLMEQTNTFGEKGDSTGHAERVLMTRASVEYDVAFLRGCTMYTNAEPCAMCAGSVYWAGVGRVVHGLSEHDMKEMIGPHPENLTMDLPCRTVFAAGQRPVEVIGPILAEETAEIHKGFW